MKLLEIRNAKYYLTAEGVEKVKGFWKKHSDEEVRQILEGVARQTIYKWFYYGTPISKRGADAVAVIAKLGEGEKCAEKEKTILDFSTDELITEIKRRGATSVIF